MFSVFIALALQVAYQGHWPQAALFLQEPQEEAQWPHPSECGPPKSAMSDIKIDIKAVGRYSYEATVWVEGAPIEFVPKAPPVPDSISLSGPLGLRYVLYHPLWHDRTSWHGGAVLPPLMDGRFTMGGRAVGQNMAYWGGRPAGAFGYSASPSNAGNRAKPNTALAVVDILACVAGAAGAFAY